MKTKIFSLIMIFFTTGVYLFGDEFNPRSPLKHWSYQKIKELSEKGIFKGYSLDKFEENVPATRQEAAVILSTLIKKMESTTEKMDSSTLNTIESLVKEYSRELEELNIENNRQENRIIKLNNRISSMKTDISSLDNYKKKNLGTEIHHSGELITSAGVRRYRNEISGNNLETTFQLKLNILMNINNDIQSFFRIQSISFPGGRRGNEDPYMLGYSALDNKYYGDGIFNSKFRADKAYLTFKNFLRIDKITAGRQEYNTGINLSHATTGDGIKFKKSIENAGIELSLYDSSDASEFYNSVYNPIIKSSELISENGLDTTLFKADYQFGRNRENVIEAYYLKQSYKAFDPYYRLGDEYAGTKAVNNSVPQPADPSWTGISFKGNLGTPLNFFGEITRFDPDIQNDGRGPLGNLTGSNDLSSGNAFIIGVNYVADKNLELTLQYGSGDEEYIPGNIEPNKSLNGMNGRSNAYLGLNPSNSGYYALPTFSLTGVKDFLAKIKYKINRLTNAEFKIEDITDNETSFNRTIVRSSALDGLKTGIANNSQDLLNRSNSLRIYEFMVNHKYSENMLLSLSYKNITYDDSYLDMAKDFNSNSKDFGGWSDVKAQLEVKF